MGNEKIRRWTTSSGRREKERNGERERDGERERELLTARPIQYPEISLSEA